MVKKLKRPLSKKATLLIVEDELLIAKDLKNILEDAGYTVVAIVDNGKEAILKAKKLKPDLVLMDIVLKGDMDGIEAAKIIMETVDIPVIYASAYADETIIERAKLTKPSGFVLKPFKAQELLVAIAIGLYKYHLDKSLIRSENKLKVSLKEKEILLKEIHHRVKNNMQLISSILHLQSKYIDDKQARAAFIESQSRIRSMAIVHESLYRTSDYARIDFSDYIRKLADGLADLYGIQPAGITFDLDVKHVFLDMNRGVSCGLIVNELLTNAYKYAFLKKQKQKKIISVRMHAYKKSIRLIVADNGIGLPKKINLKNPKTLGLQLVMTLVRQLDGVMKIVHKKGTSFIIIF